MIIPKQTLHKIVPKQTLFNYVLPVIMLGPVAALLYRAQTVLLDQALGTSLGTTAQVGLVALSFVLAYLLAVGLNRVFGSSLDRIDMRRF